MSLLACNAQQVRHGGAVTQPAARPIGPGCMDTPAKHTAKLTVLKRITVGRRMHRVRHGQGRAAQTARLEVEGVEFPELMTDDP